MRITALTLSQKAAEGEGRMPYTRPPDAELAVSVDWRPSQASSRVSEDLPGQPRSATVDARVPTDMEALAGSRPPTRALRRPSPVAEV